MPIDATHWTVERDNGNIRYIGSDHGGSPLPSYATVIELHRWLQGLADDQTAGASDDEVDITELLPSSRATDNIITLINGYNIDDTAAEHLYDGTIIQNGGDDVYDGFVNYGNAAVQIQIIQNGALLTDDWWNQGGAGLNADATNGISHRFMLKTRSGGTDIDNKRVIGTNRRFGFTYGEFIVNSAANGNNTLALSDSSDLNNATAAGTVATWTSITNVTQGFFSQDVDNDTTDEDYYSEWDVDKPTRSINDFYERLKWLTRDGANADSPHYRPYDLDPEVFRGITHEIDVDTPVNTLPAYGPCSWSGGTGQLLATNSTTTPTKIWIQLLTGTAPSVDNTVITFTSVSPNATVQAELTGGSVTERPISTPFVGQSTGTSIVGSYGLGIQKADLTSADRVFDLTDTQITPPNNVTFSVAGLVHNEDYVYIAPWDGSSTDANGDPAVDKDFLRLNTTLNGASETSIVCTAAIPTWVPASGTLRIVNDEGINRYLTYDSYTGSTFTIPATAFNGSGVTAAATAGSPSKNIWPTMIDQLNNQSPEATTLSFNSINTVNRNLVVIVRDGGGTPIKQYIATAILGSTDSTITAIRTADT